MRDAHRIKEKFELSLDNRQVVSILISGLVVVGAVFVLGVVVGKKLSTNQVAAAAPDLLTALDHKTTEFTFQDELTKKVPVEFSPKPIAPKPSIPAETAAADSAKPETVPAAAQAPKPVAPPAQVVEATVKDAPSTARTAETEGASDLRRAMAKAVREPVLPKEAQTGGKFTLQLAATQTKEEAQRFLTRVRDHGYAPFMVEATVAGRGTWYRVRMGSFPSREAAIRYLADFRRETQMEAFVTNN